MHMIVLIILYASVASAATLGDLVTSVQRTVMVPRERVQQFLRDGHDEIIAEAKLPAETVVITEPKNDEESGDVSGKGRVEQKPQLAGKRVAAEITKISASTVTTTYIIAPKFESDTDKPFAGKYQEYETVLELYALYKAYDEIGDRVKADHYRNRYITELAQIMARESRIPLNK
jgi:hypothetical protein